MFEGAEKTIEVEFVVKKPGGLRNLSRKQVDELLTLAACTALSVMKNEVYDAYVLSESSLFVRDDRILLKTCGSTCLLACLPRLMEMSAEYADVVGVYFSRKDYLFPERQPNPHKSWKHEVEFLNQFFPNGRDYSVKKGTCDWYFYVAKLASVPSRYDQSVEMMMWEIDRDVLSQFVNKEGVTKEDVTAQTGIGSIFPGSDIDEFVFFPCGYSMNGLLNTPGGGFFTIHVTPEPGCDFVSFEAHARMDDYSEVIAKVLEIFKPGEVTVAVFSDRPDCSAAKLNRSPLPAPFRERAHVVYADEVEAFTVLLRRAHVAAVEEAICIPVSDVANLEPLVVEVS